MEFLVMINTVKQRDLNLQIWTTRRTALNFAPPHSVSTLSVLYNLWYPICALPEFMRLNCSYHKHLQPPSHTQGQQWWLLQSSCDSRAHTNWVLAPGFAKYLKPFSCGFDITFKSRAMVDLLGIQACTQSVEELKPHGAPLPIGNQEPAESIIFPS